MRSTVGRMLVALAAAAVLLAAASAPEEARAGVIPYPQTDIMFVFDTTGSMEEAIDEAKSEMVDAMGQIAAKLPNVAFGLSSVRDYGGSIYDEENPGDKPWQLEAPIAADPLVLGAAISNLTAFGGGDGPESYGRALWEAANNPRVGWRAGSRHLIVLIADNVPHDAELNEGIPASSWYEISPWDTGTELLEAAGVPSTPLNSATNLDWQAVLQQLAAAGKPLQFVNYQGPAGFLPYWENWAGRTGGRAAYADAGELVEDLVGLAELAGVAAACESAGGHFGKRLVASLKCAGARTWLEVKCGVELSIGKALKVFKASKTLIKVSKVRKAWKPLARLHNRIKQAKFKKGAPKWLDTPQEVLERFGEVETAWDAVKLLREVNRAVSSDDLKRIALAIGDIAGARACVTALLSAVE